MLSDTEKNDVDNSDLPYASNRSFDLWSLTVEIKHFSVLNKYTFVTPLLFVFVLDQFICNFPNDMYRSPPPTHTRTETLTHLTLFTNIAGFPWLQFDDKLCFSATFIGQQKNYCILLYISWDKRLYNHVSSLLHYYTNKLLKNKNKRFLFDQCLIW